ncbi:uncharacterized protein [Rhodnius prolixus]|uniref:uncharacterized protein n=1 Tax=Rhodnius prolixus TaxID=13249 RepID=UPI003D189EE5
MIVLFGGMNRLLLSGAILTVMVITHTVAAMTWMDGAPLPLYHARSGKRQHLPYHPVARFRGADSRPYYPYEFTTYNDFLPSISTADSYDKKMNAGELLALLFSGLKDNESARMRGTLRFGIVKR